MIALVLVLLAAALMIWAGVAGRRGNAYAMVGFVAALVCLAATVVAVWRQL